MPVLVDMTRAPLCAEHHMLLEQKVIEQSKSPEHDGKSFCSWRKVYDTFGAYRKNTVRLGMSEAPFVEETHFIRHDACGRLS